LFAFTTLREPSARRICSRAGARRESELRGVNTSGARISAHLQRRGRLALVDAQLGRIADGRRRRARRGAAAGVVAHAAPLAREGLARRRRRLVRLAALVDEVDVGVGVAELRRHPPRVDGLEERRVGGVVGGAQRAVVDGEAVLPEGDCVRLRLLRRRRALVRLAAQRLAAPRERLRPARLLGLPLVLALRAHLVSRALHEVARVEDLLAAAATVLALAAGVVRLALVIVVALLRVVEGDDRHSVARLQRDS
jgi:hypothetical protein